jgi:hypothetical protein
VSLAGADKLRRMLCVSVTEASTRMTRAFHAPLYVAPRHLFGKQLVRGRLLRGPRSLQLSGQLGLAITLLATK